MHAWHLDKLFASVKLEFQARDQVLYEHTMREGKVKVYKLVERESLGENGEELAKRMTKDLGLTHEEMAGR